jgi:hypothetical protein
MTAQELTHDKLPRPKGKALPFPQVNNFESANDYVLSAYHACVDKIGKTRDVEQRLWVSAAEAYVGTYMGLAGLKAVPGNTGLAKAKEQIAEANHKADEAAATAKA